MDLLLSEGLALRRGRLLQCPKCGESIKEVIYVIKRHLTLVASFV